MVQQPELVPLTADHADALLALARQLERDAMPCSFWGLDHAGVGGLLSAPHKYVSAALLGAEVVGIGALSRGQQYQAHLAEVSVAIAPRYRRRGLAQRLLLHLELHAAAQGVELLKALIWIKNIPSRQLFEAAGYLHRATLYAEFKSPEFGEIDDCVYYKGLGVRGGMR